MCLLCLRFSKNVLLVCTLVAAAFMSGCGKPEEGGEPTVPSGGSKGKSAGEKETPSKQKGETAKKGGKSEMKIESKALFEAGRKIDKKYTGEGENISPPLNWSGVPGEAKELVLICDDPDAPQPNPWVHWVIYNIPATTTGLAENIPAKEKLSTPEGAVQGTNSFRNIGYGGPMPPPGHGTHHYHFKLYALDSELNLEPGLSKEKVLDAISGHILAEAELIGTYER